MGVWIETDSQNDHNQAIAVTPCMGVWIETLMGVNLFKIFKSHPVWVCGLKQPHAGHRPGSRRSHPVWVCGLKLPNPSNLAVWLVSHPVWVCGLKHLLNGSIMLLDSHTLYGCVDWNTAWGTIVPSLFSHTLYGCVDWNFWAMPKELGVEGVTPCMGVWIETKFGNTLVTSDSGHTLYGCVDWNFACLGVRFDARSHTLYGCVDWNILYRVATMVSVSHTLYGCVDWNVNRG